MKSREQKKKWTGKKHVWYGAAGLFCLAAAVLILTFGNGIGAKAEERTDYAIGDLKPGADGIYSITTVEQLLALGNATEEQTADKNFKLAKDLDISSITTAAVGTFAGTFDGDGYVIVIRSLQIKDSTPGTAAQGVLFGTVTGTVKNVVVDVKDENASYTRISDAGYTESSPETESWTDDSGKKSDTEPVLYGEKADEKSLVSELDDASGKQGKAYEEIKNYADTNDGKKTEWTKINTTVTSKNAKAAGEDRFGMICGELSKGGSIEKILVNGKDLNVTQEASKHEDAVVTTTGTTTKTVTYTREKNYEFTDADDETVTLDASVFYVEEVTKTGTNDEVKARFSIEASAPDSVAAIESDNEYTCSVEYTVTVKSLDGQSHEVAVTPEATGLTGGKWTLKDDTPVDESVTVTAQTAEGTEVVFLYEGTYEDGSASLSANFRASETVGNQAVAAKISGVITTVQKPSEGNEEDSSSETTYEPVENVTINEKELNITVSAPAVTGAVDGNAQIVYTFRNVPAGTVFTASTSGGTWTQSGNIATYMLSVPVQLSGTEHVTESTSFTAKQITEEKTVYAKISALSTDIYIKDAELSASSDENTGNGKLEATLTAPAYTTEESVVYTLTLHNTYEDDQHRIYIGSGNWDLDSTAWDHGSYTSTKNGVESAPLNGHILAADDVVLTKTIEKGAGAQIVTLSGIKIIREVTAYRYKNSRTEGPVTEVSENNPSIHIANSLSVGIIAGKSSEGHMTEISQQINLNAVAATGIAANGASLYAGGIAGHTEKTELRDLYVRGSVSGGSYLLGTGTVSSLQNVIATGTSDVANLGVSNSGDTVLTGASAKPADGWTNWKTYSYYQSEEAQTEDFELEWLVKEDAFSVTAPKMTETVVQTSVNNQADRRSYSYHMVYEARREQDDKDHQRYYCTTQNLELDRSGYYKIIKLYATDGYYHYLKGADNSYSYPFQKSISTKPQFFKEDAWRVVRKKGTSLEDQIQLPIDAVWKEVSLYYYDEEQSTWRQSVTDDTGGEFLKLFPFSASAVTIHVLPQYEQKFYEEETKEFKVTDHLPLPDPKVQVSDFYQEKGTENIVDFNDGSVYGNEAKLSLMEENTKCRYQYYIVDEKIDGDWKKGQTAQNALEYITDMNLFSSVKWEDVTSDFQLPDSDGSWHLYLKVSADGYSPTVYYYGSFRTASEAKVKINVYLDDGTSLDENDRVASGDRFRFEFIITGAEELGMTHLQYLTSVSELSGQALHLAEGWKAYEDTPVTIERSDSSDEYYIYARVYNGKDKYQKIISYHYTFVDVAGTVTISPRTVSVESAADTSAAATISSSAPVYLSSAEEGARILYLINDSPESRFSFVRVTENLSDLTDGKDGYFKIGNRWYQTDEKVQIYTEPVSFYNEGSSTKTQYIHTAALGTEGEPGQTVTYAYHVSPMGKTSAPEASMDTLHFPGGEDKDSTRVQKGASLSFQSLTPGAELYYVLGDGSAEVLDHEEGETKLYDNKNGIEVEGDYGNQFVVRMKAVKWSTDGTGRKELKDSETVRFIYTIADQEQAVAPNATPATSDQETTVITPGDKILLSTTTKGARIYYTTDGSAPVVTKSEDGTFTPADGTLLYDAGQGIITPVSGNGYFTVRAIAVHPDLANSPETKFTYSFPDAVQMPYANIPSGDVDMGTEIILKNKTEGAEIYYTISRDGSTPADPTISSSVFDAEQPIVIDGETIIKAIAVKDGVKSAILTLTYHSRDQLSAPTASIDSGAMVSRGTRLKLKASDGATIYYTMDGSDPSDRSNAAVVSGSELILDGAAGSTVTVKACARKDGKSVSEVVTFTYQISQSAGGVTADVPNGTLVSIGSKVNLMTDVTDAEIYYTTDGSSPTDYGIKGTVVTVEGTSGSSFTIKAAARVNGESGSVCTFTYKIKEKPTAPTASPSGGTLTVATRVELNSSADKIYYTTDGVTPTESSNLYKEPILINKTTTLKAIAVSADGEVSEVASFQYTAALKAEKPTASHDTNTVLEPGTIVALHTNTSGAEIYYSTDGTEPTRDHLDSLMLYTEDGITINRTVTIRAAAYREDMQLSTVTELYYQVETIPAVEQKAAEKALLEEQQLKDTDSSELARNEEQQGTSYQSRVLRERDYSTVVSSAWESIPSDAVLVTEEQDYAQEALNNVRQLFGADYTIISSYNMYLMRGGTMTQPQGEVEIGMPIPQKYENAAVTIVYIDNNNKITKKETRRQDGMAYAKTDHFSHYALVGLEEETVGSWKVSYLTFLEAAAAATVIAGLAYYISRKWKKMKRDS